MSDSRSQPGTRARAAIAVVAVAYALLAGLLVVDVVQVGSRPRVYPPRKVAKSLLSIAEQSGRVRAINPVIAIAAREIGAEDVVLEVPKNYAELLLITPDNFAGNPTPTLNAGLMAPFIGGRVRVVEYDAVLPEPQARAIEAAPNAVDLPRDVWGFAGGDEAPTVVRLYTDPARMHVYVAPVGAIESDAR